MNTKELRKKIKPAFTAKQLDAMGLEGKDKAVFLNYKIIPVALLVRAPWNYKEEHEQKSKALSANMERNGQIENLHVREIDGGLYEVVNGNHRLDDMAAKGKEFAFCYDHGQISEAEAKRIAVETNETRFPTDYGLLSGIIQELSAEYDMEELSLSLPYSDAELAAYLGEEEGQEFEGGSQEIGFDDLDKKMKIVLEYEYEEYEAVRAALAKIAQTPEAAVMELLSIEIEGE